MRRLQSSLTLCLLAVGCYSTGPGIVPSLDPEALAFAKPIVHPESVSDQDAAMLGALSKLEGEWDMIGENGEKLPGCNFAVTSAGTAVREIMFPGAEHEMTNLYHMDGGVLVCTHYCAAGNQPRMVAEQATQSDEGTVFLFDFESVSNLRASHDHYMGNLTLTVLSDGNLREDWRSYDHEGKLTEPVTFLLTRKDSSAREG